MSGFRRAAAELHGLSEIDQKWILAALPSSDQATITTYLAELKNLGFSNNSFVASTNTSQSNTNLLSTEVAAFGKIHSATAATMLPVLSGESCSFIAQVLSVYPWIWTDDFLHRLNQPRQNLVKNMLRDRVTAPTIRQKSILRVVNARLELHLGSSVTSTKIDTRSNSDVGIFSKALHLVKQWKP